MTDQPHPDTPGHSGAWQPVPGGGDYDPDQTMHVSFAAQLPPEPRPGEDPLGAHGPTGPANWSIPVMRDDTDGDSEEFSVGAYTSPWDQAPSPAAPTQTPFPAGMFGQGAAAAQAARVAESGAWSTPGAQPAVPWLPVEPPAAETAWAAVVDDPGAPAPDVPAAHTAVPDHSQPPYSPGPPTPYAPVPQTSGQDRPGADLYVSGAADGPAADAAGRLPEAAAPGRADGEADSAHPAAAQAPRTDGPGRLPEAENGGPPAASGGGLPGGFGGTDRPGPDSLEFEVPGRGADLLAADPQELDGTDPDGADDTDGPDAAEVAGTGPLEFDAPDPRDFDGPERPPVPDPAGADERLPAADAPAGLDHPETADGPDPASLAAFAALGELGAADADEAEPAEEPSRSEHPLASYTLRVNGADRPVTEAWLGESLLYVLRERLGLAGAKDGCEQGECGACSVQVDGRLVASCLVPAATAAGSEVRTVEGLAVDGKPSDVQRALADSAAVQCGFCLPGMAMTVHDLLEGNHRPTDLDVRRALCGNLCRCSGYRGVLDAVREVVAARDATGTAAEEGARVPHQGGPAAAAAAEGEGAA